MNKKIRILNPDTKKLFHVTIDTLMIENATRFPVTCFVTLDEKPYIVYIDANFKVRGVEPIYYIINDITANVQNISQQIKVYSDKSMKETFVLDANREIFIIK